MSPDLEKKLVDEFPQLYRLVHDTSSRTPIGAYGITVGDGWYEILRSISAELRVASEAHSVDLMVSQVKATFRRLIIGTHWSYPAYSHLNPAHLAAREAFEKIRSDAEELSASTCQGCGAPARAKPKSWRDEGICDTCRQR